MKVIGLTGGIGSGKSTVAKVFHELFDIPIYHADERAKFLMQFDKSLKSKIIVIIGQEAYLPNNQLNKQYIAGKIFNDDKLLESVNQAVHQQVEIDFKEWVNHQKTPYVLHEAAILIESGFHKHMDGVITVSAAEEIRIKRVQERDKLSSEQILQRINKQLTDVEREKEARFVIINDESKSIIDQVSSIHKMIIKDE
ncbi:MAG: dephospho-CoA kinase [Salinivirgaceae bacterium]|nr:MAG: dephospho-CoA kinase [Salinivirgaceae bacterium]